MEKWSVERCMRCRDTNEKKDIMCIQKRRQNAKDDRALKNEQ